MDQYDTKPSKQQQFGTAGIEEVNDIYSLHVLCCVDWLAVTTHFGIKGLVIFTFLPRYYLRRFCAVTASYLFAVHVFVGIHAVVCFSDCFNATPLQGV